MRTTVTIVKNGDKEYCGPARAECSYPVIKEGVDWYLIKVNGKSVYVQKEYCESDRDWETIFFIPIFNYCY